MANIDDIVNVKENLLPTASITDQQGEREQASTSA